MDQMEFVKATNAKYLEMPGGFSGCLKREGKAKIPYVPCFALVGDEIVQLDHLDYSIHHEATDLGIRKCSTATVRIKINNLLQFTSGNYVQYTAGIQYEQASQNICTQIAMTLPAYVALPPRDYRLRFLFDPELDSMDYTENYSMTEAPVGKITGILTEFVINKLVLNS